MKKIVLSMVGALACAGCAVVPAPVPSSLPVADGGIFFDDFNYKDNAELTSAGWMIRDKAGLPGVAGAHWGDGTVSVVDDPALPGNRLLEMVARTDGTANGTYHSQVCHQRKYFEGTFATRIRLTDEPTMGPDGDVVIQAYYLISPLRYAYDPKYSELDWEYLANGGWGNPKTRLYSTSWQTVRLDPWDSFNQSHENIRPLGGWHTLMMQAAEGKIHYFLDGVLQDVHGGRNYPVVRMSLNFNIWFAAGAFLPNTKETRSYANNVDWVFHARNRVLSPAEVDAAVAEYRKSGSKQIDTVPSGKPVLANACDL